MPWAYLASDTGDSIKVKRTNRKNPWLVASEWVQEWWEPCTVERAFRAIPSQARKGKGCKRSCGYAFWRFTRFLEKIKLHRRARCESFGICDINCMPHGGGPKCHLGEIKFETKSWIIPAARMKAGKEHRIPLSEPAIALLDRLEPKGLADLIFPGQNRCKPLSNMAILKTMHRLGVHYTPHGFRSTFRTWISEKIIHTRLPKLHLRM